MTEQDLTQLNAQWEGKEPQELLSHFVEKYRGKIVFASSLGAEDQVLTDMLSHEKEPPPIFTLDTGRLFPETYELIERTETKYRVRMQIFSPQSQPLEEMVKKYGVNLFYDSVERRRECCQIRKLEPLSRALAGQKVWICGLRKEQAVTRQNIQWIEWDEPNQLLKLNPLACWSEGQVWDYIHSHKVPYNPLQDKGFRSIGCYPCTRAIGPTDSIRQGRWWWEDEATKECGLHKE